MRGMKRADLINLTFIRSHGALKECIEQSVPACMLWLVCDCMAKAPGGDPRQVEFLNGLIPDLTNAAGEPFAALKPSLVHPAGAAAAWAAAWAFDVPPTGRMAATLFIAAIHWTNAILDSGYLVLEPGSSFERAALRLIDDINRGGDGDHADEFEAAHHSAPKLARRIQERFEDRAHGPGLFIGATAAKKDAA